MRYQRIFAAIMALFLNTVSTFSANVVPDECSICTECYDLNFRAKYKPKCGHAICQICLAKIASLEKLIGCPLCRTSVSLNFDADGVEQNDEQDHWLGAGLFIMVLSHVVGSI